MNTIMRETLTVERIQTINGVKYIEGRLFLSHYNLTSLEPYNLSDVIITGVFRCNNNNLTSLKGAPKQVIGSFWCNDNHLTSLKDAPKQVNGNFLCYNNKLTSLEGLPETISGKIYIEKKVLQKLYFTNDLVTLYAMQDKFELL